MAARNPSLAYFAGKYGVERRWRGADAESTQQALRALELARTEATIRRAIEDAPPLDPETVARLHSLIPPATSEEVGPDAA